MTSSLHPVITQPGGHSAKNARRVGAPNNHQGSGENPMVGTTPTADPTTAVTEIQNRLYANAERFVQFDHPSGSVTVHFRALAVLVAEIVAERGAR